MTEADLLARARILAGRTIAELAPVAGLVAPDHLRGDKGFMGRLVERLLGVGDDGSGPDVPSLGIELKSLPMDARGRPLESTFVATLDPSEPGALVWETSAIRAKLLRILWIPIVGDRDTPPGARIVGTAALWSPSREDEALLRADFEQIAELVAEGRGDSVTAHLGEVMQLRPKGADAKSLRWTYDGETAVRVSPRAFYLRRAFTLGLAARLWRVG